MDDNSGTTFFSAIGETRHQASRYTPHPFTQYLIEDSSCQYGGNSYEDAEHFFLSCPKYAILREKT